MVVLRLSRPVRAVAGVTAAVLVAAAGAAALVVGVYLWTGLPVALVVAGTLAALAGLAIAFGIITQYDVDAALPPDSREAVTSQHSVRDGAVR